MAKKRTKKQKLAAKEKRQQNSTSVAVVKNYLEVQPLTTKTEAEATTDNADEVALRTTQLLSTPVKFIHQDLFKTALVTAIILVILIVLAIYY